MDMDATLMEAMLDEVQSMLEEMYEMAERASQDDCTDQERNELQGRLTVLRERIDETVDAYSMLGVYRDALLAAWRAADNVVRSMRS